MNEQLTFFEYLEEPKPYSLVEVCSLPAGEPLKVVSLFSGCGGMDLGFRGGFTVLGREYEKNPYEIIFSNDILKHPCQTYEFNFHSTPYCCDIRELDYSLLPEADVVIGGFPCQDFSVAGKRKGLSAERGRLYQEMKKVIAYCRPKAFVAENVDGIRKTAKGDDTSALDIILDDLRSIGYSVVYKPLNAADYGVPQNRVRVIIIGIRNDLQKTACYPTPYFGEGKKYPWVTSREAIDDLWELLDCPNVANHSTRDYSKAKFYPGKTMQGNCQIKADKPAPTIRSEHHGNIEGHYRSYCDDPEDVSGWRRLSVRECARLQTFPDNFIFPVSSSDAYKEIGNAVPPVLAWHIARALYISLK